MNSPVAPNRTSPFFVPLLIFLVALVLRLWGITWALSDDTRYFSYHVDETMVTAASLRVNPLLFLLDPEFYNYGSFPLLVNGFFLHLGEWVGLVKSGPAPGIPSASALLTARLVTVLLGAGTCLFLYGTGRLLYGVTAGTVAALLYAITPLAVQHGHFATVDVPATFWVAGAIYFVAQHLQPRSPTDSATKPKIEPLVLAGLFAGLAAASKYNMALVVLPAIFAWATTKPRSIATLLTLLGSAVGGFLVGCPGILLNFPRFIADVTFEANHVRQGHGDVFVNTPSGFVFHLWNLSWAIGLPLLIVVLVAIGYALYRRRPGDIMLLAFALPYYILICLATVKFARYTIPLLPPFFLLCGALIPFSESPKEFRARQHKAFFPVTIGIASASVFAFLLTSAFNSVMTQIDPRDKAAAFLKERGFASVGFATGPWFAAPTLNPLLTHPIPPMAKQAAAEMSGLRLIPAEGEWNVEQLKATDPQAVALSELNEYADALRIQKPEAVAYTQELTQRYPNHRVFANPVTFLGLPFTRIDPQAAFPTQGLPHDMNYTNPVTVVYFR